MSRVEGVSDGRERHPTQLERTPGSRAGPNWPRLRMTMRESVISDQPLSCLSQALTYLLLNLTPRNLYTETQS